MDTDFRPLPSEQWPDALEHLKGSFAEQLNVYRVMAHNPALLSAWAGFRKHVVVENCLGADLTEIAILRAAYHLKSQYERAHHIVRARACGVSDKVIRDILDGRLVDDERYSVIVQSVDELVRDARLQPTTVSTLVAAVGKPGVLDLIAIVGFYTTLGCILNSFETPVENHISAELDTSPL
ncbi:carboxymuconolactone decarboxylase family protein [Oryzicola mucosus]|uniref:Carboxymuconolactone decarboxylase family protein n=1 Tax=Oryzicola mucosus TaxID=2767425 RepID=A0A8J6PQV5_9HYPH|nr:carboxymuconolactone decarboxylase family protein [Oryzicola mucosus]MBD0417202.1 carboxymuconolactone decarboxylase family protein [Oryzicola mucosus]